MSAYVPIKTIALGDEGVGKTTMYITYNTEQYPDHYIPTIDNYSQKYDLNSIGIYLTMIDTAQRIDRPELRSLLDPGTDVFILCFDVSSQCTVAKIIFHHIGFLNLRVIAQPSLSY